MRSNLSSRAQRGISVFAGSGTGSARNDLDPSLRSG